MNSIGISKHAFCTIVDIISQFDCVNSAKVFGSRAKGNYKKYSDIDICLFGKISSIDIGRINSLLDDCSIIYICDVLAYDTISNQELKDHIDRVGITIYNK
ncbi:MAG: nucleotidyltransferase domain-containing protein [Firmicutes bacterium]|nr:nucleotidyltransferase domain-containing protein [Bacillota bacterium]